MNRRLTTQPLDEVSIGTLRDRIRRLSHDPAFGVLTRPALADHARSLPTATYLVIFLDLDHVHHLNGLLGYDEVNRRVRATFAPAFRNTDLVGRWFSGDELVLVLANDHDAAEGLIERLQREAGENGLSFCYGLGPWVHPIESLEEAVGPLCTEVSNRKEASHGSRASPPRS